MRRICATRAIPQNEIRLREGVEESVDLPRFKLAIGVQQEHPLPMRHPEPCPEGCPVTLVMRVADEDHLWDSCSELGRNGCTIIGTSIVDDDDLEISAWGPQRTGEVADSPSEVWRLVVGG